MASYLGIKPKRSWKEAVVRFLQVKATLRDIKQYQGNCRRLDAYLGDKMLNDINGDTVWAVVQGETKKDRDIQWAGSEIIPTRSGK